MSSMARALLISLVAVVALLVAFPAAALADATWHHDTQYATQSTGAVTCGTGAPYVPGESDLIHDISPEIGSAQAYFDGANPPALGDSCAGDGGTRISLEVALPAGARLATDAPYLCGFGPQDAVACPIVARPAADGGPSCSTAAARPLRSGRSPTPSTSSGCSSRSR